MGVIVQAVTGLDGQSFTVQQLATARRNGLRVQGYVWVNSGGAAETTRARLSLFDGFQIEQLYVDVEEAGITRADVDQALAIADVYLGKRAAIYTGKWVFDQHGWSNETWWSDRDLWVSIYDGVADVDAGFVPFHGWTRCALKQWSGTSSIGSVKEIDLNVMR